MVTLAVASWSMPAAAQCSRIRLDEVRRSVTLAEYDHLFNYDDWRSIQVEAMYRMTTQ